MSQKSKAWRRELDLLVRDTGTSLEKVCSYLNVAYSGKIGFYNKVPKKRNVFIGIGMAFKLPLDRINEWIVYYGEKKKLYSKDILEDLVWIYLINSNYADKDSDTNYYSLYDECRRSVWETYNSIWNEYISNDEGTVSIGKKISEVDYDEEFKGLREFIMANMDGFKTAYAKPRAMLLDYVNALLDTRSRRLGGSRSMNNLRGYLDDSMINYLSGDAGTINVLDMKQRGRTLHIKNVPKIKKTHISLCLALGMSKNEVNEYLEMMGYAPLDEESADEARLLEMLEKWERSHELQWEYKKKFIKGDKSIILKPEEEFEGAMQMLMLRQDLKYEYSKEGLKFPYMKD